MRHSRGGALPETVIVLGLTLTLLFGTFELGLIGYTQLSSDGAAFVAAHASVLGNDPAAAIASPFPDIAASGGSVTISQNAADASQVPVDYQSGPTQQSNRHGGVQIVRPFHTQATVQQTGGVANGRLGRFGLGGAFIEGNMLVSNTGFDLNGELINDPAGRRNTYFSDDGNAPPYFIGFRYLWHCSAPVPTQGCQGSVMAALGMAEYLDGSNWAQPGVGVGPNAVYGAMLLHQQVFAKIIGELPQSVGGGKGGFDWVTPACMRSVAAWDVDVPVGYPIGDKNIGYYPFRPLYNDPLC
jgi:hypothetical protein